MADPREEHIPFIQRAASTMECPVCGVIGNMRATKVVLDGEALMELRCTTEGCPVLECVAMLP